MKKIKIIALIGMLFFGLTPMAAQKKQSKSDLEKYGKMSPEILKNLTNFDTLDFVVYSNQEWNRLHESHAKNIKVVYPDGSVTVGLEDHIKKLEPQFVFAPDTKIKVHPVRFGTGNYTAVEGVMEGTFSKPMPKGDGTFIQPTGKSFKLPMITVGIWKDGVMIEEHLFWDNAAFMKQIGLS
nr:ester cyclase [uncultured Chryseobacterium sp.]